MTDNERKELLNKAEDFFRDVIVTKHVINLKKLDKLSSFNVNPFLIKYLARFLSGNDDPKSIAKALIYPRILGVSINTSFGQNIQNFCTEVLSVSGTIVTGTDIEFEDQLDGRKKYCQIKAGPETINKDDVVTIRNHFNSIKNLARQNKADIGIDDLVIAIIYGEREKISPFYKKLAGEFPLFVGQEFWHHFTGDESFYYDLSETFSKTAIDVDGRDMLDDIIEKLAYDIKQNSL